MKIIVQRVHRAAVTVNEEIVGRCGKGMLLLVAAHASDTEKSISKAAEKIAGLRIFNDSEDKMNLDISHVPDSDDPKILAISNFTVYGNTAKGKRPSFIEAAPYEQGEEHFNLFVSKLREYNLKVETGIFGAHMDVELINDGPITLIVETL